MAVDPVHDPRQLDLFPETLPKPEPFFFTGGVLYLLDEVIQSLTAETILPGVIDASKILYGTTPDKRLMEMPSLSYPTLDFSFGCFEDNNPIFTKHCFVYCGDACDCGRKDFFEDLMPASDETSSTKS